MNNLKYCAIALIGFLSLGGLLSCGLETDYYIDYIPQSVYNDTNSVIVLPSSGAEGYSTYFDNFIIFYRVYISGENPPTGNNLRTDSNARSAINATLNSDYIALDDFTNLTSTTVNTSNLENTFSNRRYFLLALENADINTVLGSASLGGTLVIFFDTNNGVQPTLTINGVAYTLRRAVENRNLNLYDLNPQPDRRFLNHPDLYNAANATNELNADVATTSATAAQYYTFVSMYIAARGRSDEMPPRTIYSQPTFIGIFSLAEAFGGGGGQQ